MLIHPKIQTSPLASFGNRQFLRSPSATMYSTQSFVPLHIHRRRKKNFLIFFARVLSHCCCFFYYFPSSTSQTSSDLKLFFPILNQDIMFSFLFFLPFCIIKYLCNIDSLCCLCCHCTDSILYFRLLLLLLLPLYAYTVIISYNRIYWLWFLFYYQYCYCCCRYYFFFVPHLSICDFIFYLLLLFVDGFCVWWLAWFEFCYSRHSFTATAEELKLMLGNFVVQNSK